MKTQTRLVTLITLGAILGFMFGATSCTGPATDKYTTTTGITPGQTALLAGKWWVDYEQAKAATEIIRATKASPVTSTKDAFDPQPKPQASVSPLPVSESPDLPPAPEPGTIRRPDAHHRQQLAAN